MSPTRLAVPVLASVLLAACESIGLGPEDGSRVTIRFATTMPSASAALADVSMSASAQELVITGSNGTLTITDIGFIVNEFELERLTDACEREDDEDNSGPGSNSSRDDDDDDEEDDDCEEFEADPFFVDLPLGGAVAVVSQEVGPGSFTELEFEVEDLDLDDENDDDMDRGMPGLLEQIRAAGFADWPKEASMVVVGSFTPSGGGAARAFTVFFDAEIELKLEFDPPLIVEDTERTVDVEIDPTVWFRTFANTVIDLSQFDFATTGKLVDFEAKLRGGFQRIEFDD